MAADLLRQPTARARARLVLLHGWGADAGDLMPLGQALAEAIATPLELVALQAPQRQSQGSGRQWYGLFPADWAAVPAAVEDLKEPHQQPELSGDPAGGNGAVGLFSRRCHDHGCRL